MLRQGGITALVQPLKPASTGSTAATEERFYRSFCWHSMVIPVSYAWWLYRRNHPPSLIPSSHMQSETWARHPPWNVQQVHLFGESFCCAFGASGFFGLLTSGRNIAQFHPHPFPSISSFFLFSWQRSTQRRVSGLSSSLLAPSILRRRVAHHEPKIPYFFLFLNLLILLKKYMQSCAIPFIRKKYAITMGTNYIHLVCLAPVPACENMYILISSGHLRVYVWMWTLIMVMCMKYWNP